MSRLLPVYLFLFVSTIGMAQEPRFGSISVSSQPVECWVKVDSLLVGKTPLSSHQVAPGRHLVQVFPPQSGIWNLQERTYEINLSAGEDTSIVALFSKPVLINSIPYGAYLFADTTRLGMTPVYIPFAEYRGQTLLLRKPGFKDYTFTLSKEQSLLARLEGNPDAPENREKPQLLGFIPRTHLKSKFTLLAITAATHWASFYFKNVADSNYDKYRRTADPQQREQFWNRTQKFDRFSEISLGVSYASLAGLIYMIIWK